MPEAQSISIVVCCYNSESRLPRVLQAIAQQKNCSNDNWEVIVVNNNSTDNTRSLAGNIFFSPLFTSMNCRVVDEPEPGLSAAREKGFNESKFDHVLFCDDDNIMEEHFIANALQLIQQFPEVDIFGSWCEGEFEIPPPAWSKKMLPALAIGKPAEKTGFIQKPVNGACMLVRKSSYRSLKDKAFHFLLSDRKGNVLTSGGDAELCYAVLLSGGSIYFSEKLFFLHFIPAARLQKNYFRKLFMNPVEQDYIITMYQWVLKDKNPSFRRFYWFLIFNYCKTLAYCFKQLVATGHVVFYTMKLKQQFSFLVQSLFQGKKINFFMNAIIALNISLKKQRNYPNFKS